MLDQFGTINVREARVTKEEVEKIVAEFLEYRGPSAYDFAYSKPIFIWQRDGGLIVRWPSEMFYDEPGRAPSQMKLMPLDQFAKEHAARVQRAEEARKAEVDRRTAAHQAAQAKVAEKEPKP